MCHGSLGREGDTELRDLIPSKAVQDSMELQMSAERRRKRALILTSEGDRESASQQR